MALGALTLYPAAQWRPVPAHSGAMRAHLGLIEHVQVGSHSCYPEFANVANQASSTWWVAKDGTVEQYVDADAVAWAEAAGNAYYDSIETEGMPDEPLTAAQIEAIAHLYAWGAKQYGWPFRLAEHPGEPGLGWHGMGGAAWGGHTHCPGDLRKAQRQQIIARASEIAAGRPEHPLPAPTTDTEGDAMSALVITYPSGHRTIATPDGAIFTAGSPYMGSMYSLIPEERQSFHTARALTAVDPNDEHAGYVIWAENGDRYAFTPAEWAHLQSLGRK